MSNLFAAVDLNTIGKISKKDSLNLRISEAMNIFLCDRNSIPLMFNFLEKLKKEESSQETIYIIFWGNLFLAVDLNTIGKISKKYSLDLRISAGRDIFLCNCTSISLMSNFFRKNWIRNKVIKEGYKLLFGETYSWQ